MIYLDHNATTPVIPEVAARVHEALAQAWGNPSSYHRAGAAAREVVEEARSWVARAMGAGPADVVFTSGGTEADWAGVLGAARAAPGPGHVVASAIEHPAVLGAVRELVAQGWTATEVLPGASGRVDPEAVGQALRPDTRICALMAANNETGVLQPVAEVGRILSGRGIFFHVDAVHALGKVPVDVAAWGADAVAISAHKVHALKGAGALWLRPGAAWRSIAPGGAQERGRRGGTENVPGIAGFGAAARLVAEGRLHDLDRIERLRHRLEAGIVAAVLDARVHGAGARRTPNTACIAFPGCAGDVLLARLDLDGVAASLGSACASGSVQPSHVLVAMGVPPDLAAASVRFSLGRGNTEAEIDLAVDAVARAVQAVRVLAIT